MVSGQFGINFAALGDINPFVHPSMSYVGTGRAQISSGALDYASGSAYVAHRYTGAMAAGVIKSKIELGLVGGSGDSVGAAIVDTSGNGYVLRLSSSTSIGILRVVALVPADFLDSATVATAPGDTFELWWNSATQELTAYQNGAPIVGLGATDGTVITGLAFAAYLEANNIGAVGLLSFAGDGGVGGAIGPVVQNHRLRH